MDIDKNELISHQEEPVVRSPKRRTVRAPIRDQGIGEVTLQWLREQALFEAWCSELAEGSEPGDDALRALIARIGVERVASELAINVSAVTSLMDDGGSEITPPQRRRVWFLLWLEQLGRLDEWRALEQPVQQPVQQHIQQPVAEPAPRLRCGVGPYVVQAVSHSLRIALLHPEDFAWSRGDRWAIIGTVWIGAPDGYLDIAAMTIKTLDEALKQWQRAKRDSVIIGSRMTRQPASLRLAHLPEDPISLRRKYEQIRQLRDEKVRAPVFLPDAWLGLKGEKGEHEQAEQALAERFKAVLVMRQTMPRIQRFNLWGARDGKPELLAEAVTQAQLEKEKARHGDCNAFRCEMVDLRPQSPLDLALQGQGDRD